MSGIKAVCCTNVSNAEGDISIQVPVVGNSGKRNSILNPTEALNDKFKDKTAVGSTPGTGPIGNEKTDDVMLAGRNIGVVVGIFTMTATWVGGAYICGSAQAAYSSGLLWVQGPFGYAFSLVIGGILFAVPMRQQGYVTMLDPFQLKYGEIFGSLCIIPALVGEICWSAAILSALGATVTVVLKLQNTISVIISACIAVFYTLAGGLYSVAYTDVIQLICILLGLVIAIPTASILRGVNLNNMFSQSFYEPGVNFTAMIEENNDQLVNRPEILRDWMSKQSVYLSSWGGSVDNWGMWWDTLLLLIFGGIPWQVYFQRVLSCDTTSTAKNLSFIAAFCCFGMSLPPIILGYIARKINWLELPSYVNYVWNKIQTKRLHQKPFDYGLENYVDYCDVTVLRAVMDNPEFGNNLPQLCKEDNEILPLLLQHATNPLVSCIGIGCICAAVMSSADSSILSCATMISRNLYKTILRRSASEKEVLIVLKISIVFVGILATCLAIWIPSVYYLWLMSSDLVYCVLFPQLLMVVYCSHYCNAYGAYVGYIVIFILRVLSGGFYPEQKSLLYWFEDKLKTQAEIKFPFKTFLMLCHLLIIPFISIITHRIFKQFPGLQKFDFLGHELLGITEEERNTDGYENSKQFKEIELRREFMKLSPMPSRCNSPARTMRGSSIDHDKSDNEADAMIQDFCQMPKQQNSLNVPGQS